MLGETHFGKSYGTIWYHNGTIMVPHGTIMVPYGTPQAISVPCGTIIWCHMVSPKIFFQHFSGGNTKQTIFKGLAASVADPVFATKTKKKQGNKIKTLANIWKT